ncbi:MAG: hypothetical protein M3O30_07130 [Planctomycetota bacterium]|nr:hypothetical protein [Planctomycetota bacterium]
MNALFPILLQKRQKVVNLYSVKRFANQLLLALVACLGAAGCSSKLETGYDPTRLDMSLAQRRTLYADPFSQEAQEASKDQPSQGQSRRPGQY